MKRLKKKILQSQKTNNGTSILNKKVYEKSEGTEKVRLFYYTTDKMQAIADAFEELLRTIAGYTSGGIEGAVMEVLLEPLFNEAGWEKRILNVTCSDAYFVEYSYEDFKMMFH